MTIYYAFWELMWFDIVMDTGNLWVNLNLPVPVPAYTREGRVWVLTGFPKGTGTGTGILRMDLEKAKKLCYKIL